jgi:Asp-tRNA(Asn)/Glu-tRNA(Gln) amidotransferase A subunit family amidase
MDKVGPIARSVEDLALVFHAIHGSDGIDPSVIDRPFRWPPQPLDLAKLRVGVLKNDKSDPAIELLSSMGCQIQEIQLPGGYPFQALVKIIDIEAASVFDRLLRDDQTEGWNTWTKSFQTAQFITAIDYLRLQRVRRKLMIEFEQLMGKIDVMVNTGDLMHTNFTGHPSVILPFPRPDSSSDQKPPSVVFTGQLFGEEQLLSIAMEFERRILTPMPRPKLPPG